MAKESYFGKYDNQSLAQQALDHGKLLKPFVAMWDDTVHYDDLYETNPGEISIDSMSVEAGGYAESMDVWGGDLYWDIAVTDQSYKRWIKFSQSDGTGDANVTVTILENDTPSARTGSFKVKFMYDDQDYVLRNEIIVPVYQEAYVVSDGYVTDGGNIVTALTGTYHEGTVGYLYGNTDGERPLYWEATSDADWFFFGNTTGAWTDSGEPTEVYAYANSSENSRSTNIVFSFYLDEDKQNLVNAVTIPFTQAGHIVQPGYVDPSAITRDDYYGGESQFTVYGDDLYWNLSTNYPWIEDFNWGDTGQGTQMKSIRVAKNPGAERTGTFTVSFYTDENRTQLKNTFDVTVVQPGENGYVPSWNSAYYVQFANVSKDAGSMTVYILNNPGNGYIKFNDFSGNDVTGTPETTAFTVSYSANNGYDERNYGIWVNFYQDDTWSTVLGSSFIRLTQEGDHDMPHVELADESYIPQSGGTKVIDIIMSGDAVKWELYNPYTGATFTDYPGLDTITGDSSTTAVTLSVAANTTDFWQPTRNVYARFFDQNDQDVCDQQSLNYTQERYEPIKCQLFNSGEGSAYMPWSFTGDVVMNISVVNGFYYTFESNDGVSGWTGDSSTALTVANIASPNTGNTINGVGFHMICYKDSAYTETAYDGWYGFDQFNQSWNGGDSTPQVEVVAHYLVSADGETMNVVNDGFNYPVTNHSLLDNECYVYFEGNQYTFPYSGSHTLSNIRCDYDVNLQGWCQNIDAYEVEVFGHNTGSSQDNGYKCHGNEYGYTFKDCTALTAVTFDQYLVDIGGDGTDNTTFDGCTALVSISCYNPTEPTINATSFNTITANTGTLHIPSGSTYSNWAAALGSNWTVVDDL